MIIDCHSHIASRTVLPPQFFDGWLKTVKAHLPSNLDVMQMERMDELLRALNEDPESVKHIAEMEMAGIDLAVLLVIEEVHLEHKRLLERSNRFIAFSGVDPRRGKEGLELFEKAVTDWGFRGLKIYAPCGYSPSDKRLFPFYEICSARKLPVLTHVGPSSATLSFRHTNPLGVDTAALNFPNVNFILGHAGVTLYRQAGLIAQYRPNIYLDLSGFQAEVTRGSFRNILKWHLSRGLSRRLLFGTDWPIHRFFGSQQRWVNEIRNCEAAGVLSAEDTENILSGNMKSLLGITGEGNDTGSTK
jgi:predicted TIM-barrel fold metal-dependent hydrolase